MFCFVPAPHAKRLAEKIKELRVVPRPAKNWVPEKFREKKRESS
jgi:hypothetical protein